MAICKISCQATEAKKVAKDHLGDKCDRAKQRGENKGGAVLLEQNEAHNFEVVQILFWRL